MTQECGAVAGVYIIYNKALAKMLCVQSLILDVLHVNKKLVVSLALLKRVMAMSVFQNQTYNVTISKRLRLVVPQNLLRNRLFRSSLATPVTFDFELIYFLTEP